MVQRCGGGGGIPHSSKKKPAGGPLFVCTVTILPRLFSQEEQVRGPSGILALNSWTDPQGKLRSRPKTRKQAGGQGYAGIRSGKVFLNLGPLVLFFDLHSRREDFNPVFARHSDGDSSARAPSRAIVTATPPELVITAPSSTGVS